jgi:hypothetical protein
MPVDDAFIAALRQAYRDRKDQTFIHRLARAVRRRLKRATGAAA